MMWWPKLLVVSAAVTVVLSKLTDSIDLEEFLQPDNVEDEDFQRTGRAGYSSICYRPCTEAEPPRTCYYRWVIEDYHTLGAACGACPLNRTACFNAQCVTADGYERGIISVNRRVPGPSIQVCLGDRIIVDVKNNMPAKSTTIHWHGFLQKDSPYMDGVPMITQCPISEGQIFRYNYVARTPGTYFWHSHDGLQKMDGVVGKLVVREPRTKDPHSKLYDYDLPSHVMLISDWFHRNAEEHFPGLRTHDQGQNPDTYLVNGFGRYLRRPIATPYAVFRVSQGKRYRFRLVGGTCTVCPAQVTMERHGLLIIASDGTPVEPVPVDSVVLYPGERYDVVLEANQIIGSYWIHVKGLGPCTLDQPYQLAILRYIGDRNGEPTSQLPEYEGFPTRGLVLNGDDGSCNNANVLCVTRLKSFFPVEPELFKRYPDVHLELRFGFHSFSIEELFQSGKYQRFFQPPVPNIVAGTVNNISNSLPPSPILSQPEDIPQDFFCPRNCEKNFCECLHVIRVPLGAVVQMLLVDISRIRGYLSHPFHLHGFAFHPVAVGVFREGHTLNQVRADLKSGALLQSSLRSTAKDTLAVPSAGYGVIRFRADNPGFWLFHCHFLYHLTTGMSVILQVGDHRNLPPVPRGFPRCGDFLPSVEHWPTN